MLYNRIRRYMVILMPLYRCCCIYGVVHVLFCLCVCIDVVVCMLVYVDWCICVDVYVLYNCC